MSVRGEVEVFPDRHVAALAVAQSFAQAAREAVAARGRFSVALSGGTAPREAYAVLAEEPFRSQVPWDRVHLFWGDERCVPPLHPRSNFGMAWRAFAGKVPVPTGNMHRMRGELPAREGAEAYARELEAFFGPGIPRFDLVHLGVGEDGHTASLFPYTDTLFVRDRAVAPARFPADGEPRITLTVAALNAAARVEVLALGAGKAAVVRAVARGPLDPVRFPAQLVRPSDGALVWMLDREAASRLGDG
jgi:6-phosphogluconolactonase